MNIHLNNEEQECKIGLVSGGVLVRLEGKWTEWRRVNMVYVLYRCVESWNADTFWVGFRRKRENDGGDEPNQGTL
jgi:hypothetical protein